MKKVYDVIEHNNIMGGKRFLKRFDDYASAQNFAGVDYTKKKSKSYTIVERIL